MLRPSLVTAIITAAILCIAPARGAEKNAGWELLKSLAGEWEGNYEGSSAHLSYRVVSAGSALVETMTEAAQKVEMITVYHRDGNALVATHYCAAGNQPRMRAESVEPGANKIAFRFADVTNLGSPEAEHMRELTVSMPDPDHLVQEWTSRAKGRDSTVVFRYTRKK